MHQKFSVPDGQVGQHSIETFEVNDSEAKRTMWQLRPFDFVPPGKYQRLVRGKGFSQTVVMSDTPMEIRTMRPIVAAAQGQVLINGLGLGICLAKILDKPSVDHVTVIEKSPEVLALVAPTFESDPRVTIIQSDAFGYQPEKGKRFNAVWHDIWDHVCADNLIQMAKLHRKYGRKTDWQGSWCRDECLRQRR